MTKNYCQAILYNKRAGEREGALCCLCHLSLLFFFFLFPSYYWRRKLQRLKMSGKALKKRNTMQQYKSNPNYLKLLNTEQTKVLCSSKELLNVCCGGARYKTDTCRLHGQKQHKPSGMLSFHLQEGDADCIHGFYLQFSTCEQ